MDRAGARHGNLTPPRISPSCPHCLWLWLDRSIITGLPARVGQDSRGVLPQCETARHRLFYGRMGTALHLIWPSLMRGLPAQMVLAHPPMSLQPPSRGLSPADVSKLPDMTASRRCFSKFNEDMFSSHLIRQKSAFLKPSFKVFFYFLYCRDNRFSDCSMGNPLYLSDPCQGISIQKEAESALLEIS